MEKGLKLLLFNLALQNLPLCPLLPLQPYSLKSMPTVGFGGG